MTAEAAYQGAVGSFSEEAATTLCGEEAHLLGCRTFDAVFEALERGRARFAVVPVANSIVGRLSFLAGRDVRRVRDVSVRVSHTLVAAPGTRLADVRRVRAHPVAAAQCRTFLAARALRVEDAWDGAGAVIDVVRARAPDLAAIAPARAAAMHGGVILAAGLEDRPGAATRFALVCQVGGP